MKILLRAFIILIGSATAPAAAQTADAFQGIRAEVRGGYDSIRFDRRNNAPDGASGASYGIGIGADLASGRFVAGLEAGVDLSSTGHCFSTGPGISFCEDAHRDLEVALRLGVAASERLLVYGKAGYSNLRLRTEQRGTGSADFVGHENKGGVRLGGGLEYRLGERTYAKTEYRYSAYSEPESEDGGPRRHQALVGVGLRF